VPRNASIERSNRDHVFHALRAPSPASVRANLTRGLTPLVAIIPFERDEFAAEEPLNDAPKLADKSGPPSSV
jgi:hypothetical protein